MSDRYERLWREAVAAGEAAEQASRPGTFAVVQRANPLDDTSPVTRQWDNGGRGFEAEGLAMVRVNGNSGFGRWLKRNGDRLRIRYVDRYSGIDEPRTPWVRTGGYYGGVTFSAPCRGYERSIAWAAGFVAAVDKAEPKAKATYFSFID